MEKSGRVHDEAHISFRCCKGRGLLQTRLRHKIYSWLAGPAETNHLLKKMTCAQSIGQGVADAAAGTEHDGDPSYWKRGPSIVAHFSGRR